ncbi:MAG: hypothetical protein AAFV95_06545 [Bacteroidota bacterium]
MKAQYILFFLFFLGFNSLQGQDIKDVMKKLDSLQMTLDTMKKDKPDKQILFSVGGNLNFLSSPKIDGAYYDVSTFFPSLSKDTTSGWRHFGFAGRLAQGRFVSGQDSFSLTNQITLIDPLPGMPGLVRVVDQDYNVNITEILSYLSFSATPTVRILGKKSPLHFAFHFEYLRRNTISTQETIVTRNDTLDVSESSMISSRRTPARTVKTSRETVNHNLLFAPGLKFHLEHKKIHFDVDTYLGRGVDILERGDSSWKSFYLTHFTAHYTGNGSFKIGGEVRSFFGEAPQTTLYIAKTFSFETLASLFGS